MMPAVNAAAWNILAGLPDSDEIIRSVPGMDGFVNA